MGLLDIIFGSSNKLKDIIGDVQDPGIILEKDIQNVINNIVYDKNIGGRNLEIPQAEDYNSEVIENKKTEDDEYLDSAAELKGLATNVIVNTYLQTKDDIYKFMTLILTTFDKALNLYAKKKGIDEKDIVFICKGGNVLKIVANEFLISLPGAAKKIIWSYYQEFFTRSDADFGIYINPKISNFQEIHTELTFLAFILQYMIREQFMEYPSHYFTYARYNDDMKKLVLKDLLDNLNKAKALNEANSYKDGPNPDYFGGHFINVFHNGIMVGEELDNTTNPPDKFIQFSKPTTPEEIQVANAELNQTASCSTDGVTPICPTNLTSKITETFDWPDSTDHFITLNHNTALDFCQKSNGDRRKFNLTRTKINFNAMFVDKDGNQKEDHFGGELIDVSVAHKLNSCINNLWNQGFKKYVLTYNTKGDILKFYAYSVGLLIEDLEEVIYVQRAFPWLDKKYEKRLNRTFYLYFLDMFEKLPTNIDRQDIIKTLQNVLTGIKNDEKNAMKNAKDFLQKCEKLDIHLKTYMKNLIRIIETKEKTDDEKFIKFIEISSKNADVLLQGFQNAQTECKINRKFDEKQIYTSGDLNSLSVASGGTKKSKYSKKSRKRSSSPNRRRKRSSSPRRKRSSSPRRKRSSSPRRKMSSSPNRHRKRSSSPKRKRSSSPKRNSPKRKRSSSPQKKPKKTITRKPSRKTQKGKSK